MTPTHVPAHDPGGGTPPAAAGECPSASASTARPSGTIPAVPGGSDRNAVVVKHLTRRFGSLTALDDLSLTLPAGRVTGLMGSNGSGKTTLLKILAGVLSDYDGEVSVAGYAPGPESKARVSFLPDAAFLAESLTVPAAISQFARLFTDFDADKARILCQHFTLPQDRTLKGMSKGMGEKLKIALTMSRRAEVYLLDEPISGVDPATREVILDGILSDFDPGALLLVSTHLIADVEPIVDSVVFLDQGRLRLAGDADDLRQAHGMGLDALFRKEYR
ncbi:ABC transporter ATP-binding protein [Actinomyces faecalis]|uniref:ABC transporter ATP-binding protein n=1 Tax=Actinomyces faecalis TaxID=2722820 RepID=UPI001554F844|nr:ABC transporter ATP-binding protein [Actinomyces faecalis]